MNTRKTDIKLWNVRYLLKQVYAACWTGIEKVAASTVAQPIIAHPLRFFEELAQSID